MLTTGKILDDRYVILNKIGAGGSGAVYLAEDSRFNGNNLVAIKEIFCADEEPEKFFRREADILYNLDHPNLPKVTNCFQKADASYIVMDYVSGEDLGQILKAGKIFSPAEVLKIADSVCDALEYLHTRTIFHRDIKPNNLKITAADKVFLLDFGTAAGNLEEKTWTLFGQSITGFTPFYAPLEQVVQVDEGSYLILQATDSEKVNKILQRKSDGRADIYSLGATMYRLLTNFPSEKATATIRAHSLWSGKNDPLPRLETLNSEVTKELANVIHRALEIEPDNRFQTVKEIKNALNFIEKNENYYSVQTFPATPKTVGMNFQNNQNSISEFDEKNSVNSEKFQNQSQSFKKKRAVLWFAIAFFVLLLPVAASLIWKSFSTTGGKVEKFSKTQAMNYSLTVQKMRDGKKYQNPFQSSGQEIFETGYQFRLQFVPPENGYFYVYSEGLDKNGRKVFNLLFPYSAEENSGNADVIGERIYKSGTNEFGNTHGTENMWLIWSKNKPELPEMLRENAFQDEKGRVTDDILSAQFTDYLTKEKSRLIDVSKDTEKQQTTVKFNGDLLIYLLQLEHR